jgi:hypothetical protein
LRSVLLLGLGLTATVLLGTTILFAGTSLLVVITLSRR